VVDFVQFNQTLLEWLRARCFTEFTKEPAAVMVDEYQKTNLLQESLYFELAKHCDGALTVVGDDDQSLYRFRGATVELFRDFEQRYQTIGGFPTQPQRVFLNANYRSAQPVIDFANAYVRLDKGYQAARVQGKPKLVNPVAQPAAGIPVLGMFRDDLDTLAADLARFIRRVTRGRGYALPSGKIIKIDRTQGGNVGDCALLCSSPKERDYSREPRLPLALREALGQHSRPIELFNPRGQDFANLESVQWLGGLLRLCLDPTGAITDKVQRAIGKQARGTLDRWADDAHTWLLSGQADPDLVNYVRHWMRRKPVRAGLVWPTHIPCIQLLYGLVHWMPELYDDPEGQIYLEVFTRQLGAAEQVSGFKAQVVVDAADPNLERNSVGHLLMYFLAPIADGTAKVDEELMDSFPRDRLAVLSIHQSKGLEFPLVIVDVGSDFRSDHWKNAFKRFPRDPNTPHHLENLLRGYSPLGKPGSLALERAFDDLYRPFFVAFSRPQDVLLLVGLTGSHPDDGSVRNVATGWTRKGANSWASNLPFEDI
jgi:DNA helicase-2/ATP-dependent DNA helicase PcrA